MEYLVIGAVVFLFLVGKGIYDKKRYRQRVRQMLQDSFGTVSDEEYTPEKLKSLQSYYRAVKRDAYDVDDITWNDLEFDEVFMLLNKTLSYEEIDKKS